MAEAYATISTAVVDGGPEPVMHVRCWEVPVAYAAQFAAVMTAIFGEAAEMISDPDLMLKGAHRAAEEGAVYLTGGEVPGG